MYATCYFVRFLYDEIDEIKAIIAIQNTRETVPALSLEYPFSALRLRISYCSSPVDQRGYAITAPWLGDCTCFNCSEPDTAAGDEQNHSRASWLKRLNAKTIC